MPAWTTMIYHDDKNAGEYLAFVLAAYRRSHAGGVVSVPTGRDKEALPQAEAQVNHGRWIAECSTGCGDAVLLGKNADLYLCSNCDVGWQLVVWPEEQAAIESDLLKRPHNIRVEPEPSSRNWTPGETVEDLRAENAERGIG